MATLLLCMALALGICAATAEMEATTPRSPSPTTTTTHRATPRANAWIAHGKDTIDFDTAGSGSYSPGVVRPANDSSDGRDGSTAVSDAPFDFDSSLDEILDYFHKISNVPTAEPTLNSSESTSAGDSASGSDGSVTDDKTVSPGSRTSEKDFLSRDPAVAEKTYGPFMETPASKKERESAATLSKICDVAFVFLSVVVAAFY